MKSLSIRQSHQYFSGNFGDFTEEAICLSAEAGSSGASLPGDFSPGKNIVEKDKHAGVGAPKGSLV